MELLDLTDPYYAEFIYRFCHLPEFVEEYYECSCNEGLSMAEFVENYHMLEFMFFCDRND